MNSRYSSLDLRLPGGLHIPGLWLRVAIVGSALLASLAIPQVVSLQRVTQLAVLLFSVGLVLSIMRSPALGPVLLIVVCLAVPSPYMPGGMNIAFIFVALLVGLWLLSLVVQRGAARLVRSRPVTPLLVFMGVVVLSFIVGQLRWFSSVSSAPLETQIGGVAIFLFSGAAFLLVANQVRDLRWLQAMTWVFIGISALHVGGWLEYSVLGPIGSRLQLGATSNSMFWVWMTALAFAQALYNGKLHLVFRVALLLLVAAVVYVSFMLNAEWKSGYLPAMVALAAIIAARSWRVGLMVGLLAIAPAIYLASDAIATDEYSYSTRIDAWELVLTMVKVNPVLGFGPANYYWYTPLFPIRGYHVNFNSHNQYVDILAQTGILGLAAFAWFAAEVGRLGWNLRNNAPEGFARAYVYGAIGGLAGMLASGVLVDWFLPFTYNIGLSGFRGSVIAWLFLGGLVSIEQMMRRDELSHVAGTEGETQHE